MNPRVKKFLKGLALTISAFILVVFGIYSIAWYTFTKRAEVYINAIWQDKANFTITGDQPRLSGYPFVPTAKFAGTFDYLSAFKFTTPELFFSGFPAPQQTQTLDAPNGLQISSTYLERDLNFDYAYLQFKAPALPQSDRREDITAWQKSGRTFTIQQIILKSGKIYAHGDGTFSLDENLQLSANINARIVGMDVLFDDLAAEKGEKTIAIARNFFNMMSQVDEKTGEKYFETTLKIQNRGIYFGPMRISGLPEIKWR
jgi:hypothetical protein